MGDGKYDNQQRMGLGGKVGNGGQLVAAVDDMAAVALAAQVQMVAVKEAELWRRWGVTVFNGAVAVATGIGYAGGRRSNKSERCVEEIAATTTAAA